MAFPEPFNLEGKVAVVTGAGVGGLGHEFAVAMAEAGADVVCSDIDEEKLRGTIEAVQGLGRKALAVQCDVTNEADVTAMIERAVNEFGRLDILINNAGISPPPAPLHETRTEDWKRVHAVNLDGVYFCAREALKVMVRQRSGKVINIASMWGLAGASSVFPIPGYNSSKGAVVNLTRELGLEYAPLGIQVNAICPGFFRTRLAGGAYDDPDFVAAVTAFTPAGRIADAREIRGAAVFLASKASDFMSGHPLVIDGGCLAK